MPAAASGRRRRPLSARLLPARTRCWPELPLYPTGVRPSPFYSVSPLLRGPEASHQQGGQAAGCPVARGGLSAPSSRPSSLAAGSGWVAERERAGAVTFPSCTPVPRPGTFAPTESVAPPGSGRMVGPASRRSPAGRAGSRRQEPGVLEPGLPAHVCRHRAGPAVRGLHAGRAGSWKAVLGHRQVANALLWLSHTLDSRCTRIYRVVTAW